MTRYVLILYRENGWNYDRCSGHREDLTETLFEKTCTKDRSEIVNDLANSFAQGGLNETGSEYQPRQHTLFINGCPFDPSLGDEWFQYDDEDEQEAHKEGVAIFAEAHALVDARIEAAKTEAERKANEEAERQKKLVREREVNYLARLTKERDDLAKKLGVSP